jgi:SAM-dependent methyltransferase
MVTDLNSNYTSPAGKEFSFAAARFSGINPSSKVLDLGCGYGDASCNLAAEFRCKVTAVDISAENISYARQMAVERNVSHLINFVNADLTTLDYTETPFELILMEGGILSFISRHKGLNFASAWLGRGGWFSFSDLILLTEKIPDEILNIFEHDRFHYENEQSYRNLLDETGFDIHFMSLVPPSGWDNYYAHMARRLEDSSGFFADKQIKMAFHKEIDVFYRLEAYRYIGYLFCIARKKSKL